MLYECKESLDANRFIQVVENNNSEQTNTNESEDISNLEGHEK